MTDATKAKLLSTHSVRVYYRQTGRTIDELAQLLRTEHPTTVMRPGMVHAVDDEVDPWPPEAA